MVQTTKTSTVFANVTNGVGSTRYWVTDRHVWAYANDYATTNTHYLNTTGFGLNVPVTKKIYGIKVELPYNESTFALAADVQVYLTLNGAMIGSNKALNQLLENQDTPRVYGGENDTWGAELTPQMLNDPTFGVMLMVRLMGTSVPTWFSVTPFSMTVYYDYIPNTADKASVTLGNVVLSKVFKSLSWNWNRIGGCGDCSVIVSADNTVLDGITADSELKIMLNDNDDTGLKTVYRGFLVSHKPVRNLSDTIELTLSGYVSQLRRVRIKHTYAGMEVSAIVKDILDNYVLPITDILYDVADIENTNYVVDTITFDEMADSAIKTLADIAGMREWGVDVNKKFFFKARSSEILHYLRYKEVVVKYDTLNDWDNITNRIYLKGADAFEKEANNSESQSLYGIREKILQVSSLSTNSVANRYCTMYFADNAKVTRRVTIKLERNKTFFENTVPLGKICVIDNSITRAKKYGEASAIYGAFKYGGLPSFQIDSIKYTLDNEGTTVNISAGQARPDLAESIKRLEFELEQLRNA